MKRFIIIFTVFLSASILAQKPIEKTIGDFNELKVYDLIEVEFVKANENKVIITGKNVDDVLVNNKNGTLKIKMNFGRAFDGRENKVVLHYTVLDIIDANEGANIHSKDLIKQFEIDLRAQEGGKISVPLDVTYANIKSVSGGQITTTGTATNQKVSLSTGGVYKGEFLLTEKTEIDIKAAGEAHVKASKLADIKIKAGGNVVIYGKPEKVNESKVFGGRVKYVK
jgi:hypothetical protein